jgi:hypothetical protein
MSLFTMPLQAAYDLNGKPFVGAKLNFYKTGTRRLSENKHLSGLNISK